MRHLSLSHIAGWSSLPHMAGNRSKVVSIEEGTCHGDERSGKKRKLVPELANGVVDS